MPPRAIRSDGACQTVAYVEAIRDASKETAGNGKRLKPRRPARSYLSVGQR